MREKIILPPTHFRDRIKGQYSDIPLAIVREILQNSSDAGAGRIDFTFPADGHGFSAQDNGKGMNLENFREYYLTLGGTKKDTGSIGGFGVAKEVLSFAWQDWECEGQDFIVHGSGAADPESNPGGIKRGFRVAAQDPDLNRIDLAGALVKLLQKSKIAPDVYLQSSNGLCKATQGRTLRKNQLYHEYEFGKLYIVKSGWKAGEEEGYLHIRTRGLFTGSDYIGGDFVYYLDLQAASGKVLNENRETLRYELRIQIQRDLQAIAKKKKAEVKKSNARLTIYGDYYSAPGQTLYTRGGPVFDMAPQGKNLWRKTFTVAEENTKARLTTQSGNIRPKYAKALEVWSLALNQIAEVTGLHQPLPGLYFGKEAVAICATIGSEEHAVCAKPDAILKNDPFWVLELALHELAHYKFGHNRGQDYESFRMELAGLVAPFSLAIIQNIRQAQM